MVSTAMIWPLKQISLNENLTNSLCGKHPYSVSVDIIDVTLLEIRIPRGFMTSLNGKVVRIPGHFLRNLHDDVIKWKHFPRNWPFVRGIHRSPVNSPHKGQWRGALVFSLVCVRINGWVNNREAGDLRRYRTHYDVTVMTGDRCHGIPITKASM